MMTRMTQMHRSASPIEARAAGVTASPADAAVRRSYAYCQQVARHRARNFYYGLVLTPEPKRSALYAIYGFMRACDDLADDPGGGADHRQRLERIEAFRHRMQEALNSGRVPSDDPQHAEVWPAFLHVMQRHKIDVQWLHAMLDGQCADLRGTRYTTFDQTYDYCYKVAGTVGQVCLGIWGYTGGAATLKLAEYRGVALQLTNILRDLAEDVRQDRVYLPAEDLRRYGIDPGRLSDGRADESFDRLMSFQIDRARSYYVKSAGLEASVNPACRATCWAMMKIYRGLLEKIARNPRRVLRQRVRLTAASKAWIAMHAVGRRWLRAF